VVFAGVAGVIAALAPARRAAKLNVLEAITTE
jgi:ABC-type antimicrobial peptide transport system permease subunit